MGAVPAAFDLFCPGLIRRPKAPGLGGMIRKPLAATVVISALADVFLCRMMFAVGRDPLVANTLAVCDEFLQVARSRAQQGGRG